MHFVWLFLNFIPKCEDNVRCLQWAFWCVVFGCLVLLTVPAQAAKTVTDAAGRQVTLPENVERVVCSGPGCLRLLTYLQAQDRVVAVDDAETKERGLDARPYALANPQFQTMPVFGSFRGQDNPERLLTLDPGPQVIFKTYPHMGFDPEELQAKTGIPVVILHYGDLGPHRATLFSSLKIMGRVLGKPQRAEEVIGFFSKHIRTLAERTASLSGTETATAYVGGVAFKGPHGFQSTEPDYPPFQFVNARNVVATAGIEGNQRQHADIAKEQLLEWDPSACFVDLSTLQLAGMGGALHELRHDPAYQFLSATQDNKVYGLLPYNWYTKNFGSVLANAYFIGKTLYPQRFKDINPAAQADRIYTFLVGAPVFDELNQGFDQLAFTRLECR
ncbi:periplasmic binding protein [Desulfohalobium retbaense DSM 5692]|uniref:Periplasmic binding protein n=1 Tax=Desulfohalobium retbaense (strain ATCC 49708 / DSM 5692 / JCM 16813 / HR100) TaxID=485915 RepID=C8X4T4_DESRD|nr:periplasmic binding protein [Desulfohalobium retbaense DSM 5692]